jgi:tetratricopeptide (TPR) repeat protein
MHPSSPGHIDPVEQDAWGRLPSPRPTPEEQLDAGRVNDAPVDSGGWARRTPVDDSVAHNDEGAALFAAGRFREAVPEFEQALAGCRSLLGPEHPGTLTVAGNLGVAQVAAGQRRKGLKIVVDNLADRVRVLGDDHPDTLTARDALAAVHRTSGNVDDAVAMSGKVALQRARRLGPTHPDTLTSRMGLALAHAAAGDVSSAHRLLAAALSDAQEAYGARHSYTLLLLECGHSWGLIGTDA